MLRPSSLGSRSTEANFAVSAATRSRILRPCCAYATSRPRNMLGGTELDLVVMFLDLGPQLDLAQLHVVRLLAGLAVFFVLLVAQPAVIVKTADRRHGHRRDFDQVDTAVASHRKRIPRRHDPELRAIIRDHAHLRHADLLVDAKLTANGKRFQSPPSDLKIVRCLRLSDRTGCNFVRRSVRRVVVLWDYNKRSEGGSSRAATALSGPPRRGAPASA